MGRDVSKVAPPKDNSKVKEQMREELKRELKEELREEIMRELLEEHNEKKKLHEAKNMVIKKEYDNARNTMKNSDVPWFDFLSYSQTGDNRLQVEMDWNQAFIDALRRGGHKGLTDEDLVSSWLQQLPNMFDEEPTR